MFPSQISSLFKTDLFFIPSVFGQKKLSQQKKWSQSPVAKYFHYRELSVRCLQIQQTGTAAKFTAYWGQFKGKLTGQTAAHLCRYTPFLPKRILKMWKI